MLTSVVLDFVHNISEMLIHKPMTVSTIDDTSATALGTAEIDNSVTAVNTLFQQAP